MLNLERLIESREKYRGKINFTSEKNKKVLIAFNKKQFGCDELNRVISFLKTICEHKIYCSLPVLIKLGDVEFADKLTYVMLECILYHFIKEYDIHIILEGNFTNRIDVSGLQYSPMFILNQVKNNKLYIDRFNGGLYLKRYRKNLKREKNSDGSLISNIMQDTDFFLKHLNINKEYRDYISEIIAELVDNSFDHAESDCLVDIDIAENFYKREAGDVKFYSVNIVVVNFAKKLMGQDLKSKITSIEKGGLSIDKGRYLTVLEAKRHHEKFYDENYEEHDFFAISSFQHKISGRDNTDILGGTGLTKLVRFLEEKSEEYSCYMLSGDRGLILKHEYLDYDSDGWIGFNKESDYIHSVPDQTCLSKSKFYLPGTAYNLNFILKDDRSDLNE